MFNLVQLQLIHAAINRAGVGYEAAVCGTVHEVNTILAKEITAAQAVEERRKAATALRAVAGGKADTDHASGGAEPQPQAG